MKRKMIITATLVGCFVVCLASMTGLAGKWKGFLKDSDGDNHWLHLVINDINGEKVIGTFQGDGDPLTINDGKINGDNFSFNVKDPDGHVITMDGKYIAAGDSISLNFGGNNMKLHVTFVRDDK